MTCTGRVLAGDEQQAVIEALPRWPHAVLNASREPWRASRCASTAATGAVSNAASTCRQNQHAGGEDYGKRVHMAGTNTGKWDSEREHGGGGTHRWKADGFGQQGFLRDALGPRRQVCAARHAPFCIPGAVQGVKTCAVKGDLCATQIGMNSLSHCRNAGETWNMRRIR